MVSGCDQNITLPCFTMILHTILLILIFVELEEEKGKNGGKEGRREGRRCERYSPVPFSFSEVTPMMAVTALL